MTSVEHHKFNDDLLLTQTDLDAAGRKYPTIIHILDHQELRDLFLQFDKSANEAKRKGRQYGLWAIALILAALVIAACENLLQHPDSTSSFMTRLVHLPTILALVSAACGLMGVFIGGLGILFSGRKRNWLHDRLMTERLRQYHFQTLVLRLPEILQSLKYEAAKAAFVTQRDLWFESFKSRFVEKLDSELTRATSDEHESDVWLHSSCHDTDDLGQSDRLDPLFRAYRELRIEHQLGYVNHKLRDDQNLFSNAPRSQAALFSNVGFLCIAMLCAIHLFSISVIILNPSEWEKMSWVISILSIILALVALAIRAVEQGLQPEREVERYQQYRSALRATLERFDLASSTTEKIAIMREMERLCFDEMRDFLITTQRSRFVMLRPGYP